MDLRCKFGVDCCSLPARDIAIFICATLRTNVHKTEIFSWNYVILKCFHMHGLLHVRVSGSRLVEAGVLSSCVRAAKVSSKVPCCH